MEGRVKNSGISEISEKSRALELQSPFAGKSSGQNSQENGGLKRRKRSASKKNEEIGFGQAKKRRKGRKEVSLSSFENAATNNRNDLDSKASDSNKLGLKLNGFALFDKNLTKKKKKNKDGTVSRSRNSQNLSSLCDISHSFDDCIVVIPKRPRGFSRRNKFQSYHVGKQTVNSLSKGAISWPTTLSSENSAASPRSKLNGDPKEPFQSLAGKRKKILDEFKDNSSSGTNSISQFKGEDDGSVQFTAPRVQKRERRNRGKRQKYEGEKQTGVDANRPLVENTLNNFEDLQEDDEENLEQNAARMLSSRFDPSCTGFSRGGVASKSQSTDGSPFSPLFQRAFKSLGVDSSVGSDAVCADTTDRVLRPRKQYQQKGFFRRRRRHFYEVCSRGVDPYWVVNQRIMVFWPLDQSWYFGVVKGYNPETKLHHIKYDDRDKEWINLQNERFKLLLFAGEVPGKSCSDKPVLEGRQTDEDVDVKFGDENCMGKFMDSEPIITWLSRSTHRLKSSPPATIKKQKQSRVLKNLPQPIFSENSVAMPKGCIDVDPFSTDTNKLCMSSVIPDRSVVGEFSENSLQAGACFNDRKMPLVYFRRRFRNRCQGLADILVEKSTCTSAVGPVTLLASAVDRVGVLDEFDIALHSSRMKNLKLESKDILLTYVENHALLKLSVSLTKSEVYLKLSLPPLRVFDIVFGAESFWLHNMFLLFKFGTLMAVWPNVQVEMLFVDNIVGLRFMLFEGCLKQAVAFLCFILEVLHQPKEYGQLGDLQLPFTSIRFKLLGLHLGSQLEFVFYNFLELESSRWLHVDNKLKQHCIVTKELPLAECTYANIETLQSGSDQIHIAPVCQKPVSLEGLQKRSRQSIMCRNCSSCTFDGRLRRLPPLVLSFAAAPTFFLSLHLNLLMENNVASVSLQNHGLDQLTDDGSCLVGDSLDKDPEIMLENMRCSLSCAAAATATATGWLSCVHSKVEAIAPSVGDGGDCIKTLQKPLNSELDVSGTSVGFQGAGKSTSDGNVTELEKCPCDAGPWRCVGKPCPSSPECLSLLEKSENGCFSRLNGINIMTSSFVDVEGQPLDLPTQTAKVSVNKLGTWNMIDGPICSPNPTAPRSMWHRSRHGSVSSTFGYRSKLWPDFTSNGFVNGYRKPRTQVSYLLPFGGYNFGSKPRSYRRKGHPYKRNKNDNLKVSDGSGGPQRYLESLSCDANILVTVGDRGWREYGAQVVLESVDHKDWRLLVKILGATKYSHKAHQFLQVGTTNRYTHAMMWKGGEKDWMLEFPDRSQWTLFKDMHEECYNRNIRAALVKNIPIPGVRVVEDSDDGSIEVPFVRTPKYFLQIGTEVDMAMDPSRVLYDMDSDDEEWISKLRSSSDTDGTKPPEISEQIVERVMDMFEKVAYAQQRENVTSDDIEHLMVGVGPMDVIKAIHEHWQQKRQRKGMSLIRQLQPALWERYQQQVKEWELATSKAHNFSDGCKEKAVLTEKPPMFAFCLRPRGLEVPNKGTKQRSQRKYTVLCHHNYVSRESDGLQVNGRKVNGFVVRDEKALVTDQNYVSSEVSPWLQTSTKSLPRDTAGPGILSMSSDWSERNQCPNLHRNKSKKMGIHLSPRDSQMASMPFNQRTMGKRNGVCQPNIGLSEWHSPNKYYQMDGYQRHRGDQLGGPDFNEFRLRDASGAAQHALNMAKLKRERALRLHLKADLAVQKAVAALMTAKAIKASENDSNDDG